MSVEQLLEHALDAGQPPDALRALLVQLSREGRTKEELYAAMENVLVAVRARQRAQDAQEEIILDLMDALSGWCHQASELLPEERPGP